MNLFASRNAAAPQTCRQDEISCDGQCYPQSIRCNGHSECSNGWDEENCGRPDEDQQTESPQYSSTQAPSTVTCPVYKCPGEEVCFTHDDRCNGRKECSDGYDEYGCPAINGKCRDHEFKCDDDICIPAERKCDKVRDCRDGSDERDCQGCSQEEFTCGNGQCVPNYRKCDGRRDCSDGSDESYSVCQPKGCAPGEFQCNNGDCIHSSAYCDGRFDCRDFSDERFCPSTAAPPSIDSQLEHLPSDRLNLRTYPNNQTIQESLEVVFQCRDEGPLRARVAWTRPGGRPLPPGSSDKNGRLEIPNIRLEHSGEYVCKADGYPLSTPGATVSVSLSVERRNLVWDRPPTACPLNQATCMNGECIPKSALCNGIPDCNDASDEAGCSISNRCQPNEFKCNNKKCVLKTWRCDGENDCGDNSDEEACSTAAPGSICSGSEYQCRSGQCIPKSFECDSHVDCLDGTDEVGCTKPTVAQPPPPSVYLRPGDTFNITCKAVGVPTPLVLWRLNWGHIPEKCITSSHAGFGVLTCPNIAVHDSGAYSCELLNSLGSEFVTPDTILNVSGDESVCQNGFFNDKATRPEECISCFCFGVSTQCKSADLFTYALPPPVTSLTVVGVHGPWTGQRSVTIGEFDKHDLLATRHGVQLRLSNLPVSGELPYYSLPTDYLGNQLKSYGGSFRYDVEYSGSGSPNNAPDVIITGNGNTLIHRTPNQIEEGIRNSVQVSFEPGQWYNTDSRLASREEIMMTLANVENVLVRLQYIDTVQREVELLNIVMDSAGLVNKGLGSASLVEECRCPAGYAGLSCESCAPGHTRQESGPWLGRCIREEEPCRPGTYGDPYRKIPCRPCPCPLTGGNNFAQTCYLGPDGEPTCDCNRGYTGRRCDRCSEGFIGNPLMPGGSCSAEQPPVSQCDPRGTLRQHPDGRCECKEHVTGVRCDQCSSRSFFLSPKWNTGCAECFCSGVTSTCTSSSLYRDIVRATFSPSRRNEFSLITDFEAPEETDQEVMIYNNEAAFRSSAGDPDVYFWRLPSQFAGNKITSYGGNLKYTIRYVPTQGGIMSRNNAPDVVIRSENDITILHYRRDEVAPSAAQTYEVPILEDQWQRIDGNAVTRQYLLMALADVSDIFIKATYTTTTDEAALSNVTLDTASKHFTGISARATEVEQCSCPQGHQGTSCEDCAPGYTRTGSGLYLGLCEPCECNGHSDECDVETRVCNNCRDNTEGDHCELCAAGYSGDATRGTAYDCSTDESQGQITTCPPNVVGPRCDQCRQGAFNLDPSNPAGCTECFCSGVTRSCSASRLYRQEIPAIIFEDKFPLTNRIGDVQTNEEPVVDFATNKISNRIHDGNSYYWSLPQRFLGNQLKSYGGYLSFSIENDAYGPYIPDQDIIIRGNGLTLVWTRANPNENRTQARLKESDWQTIDQGGPKVASRADLLTVLSNLEAILVRASLREGLSQAHLGDVVLDTAVQQNTGEAMVNDIEMCRCPEGYTGTSCESCDHFYYRDANDRSAGLLGICKRCPCENADSCSLESNGNVLCNCLPGFYGDRCTDYETTVTTERPRPPIITVVVSSPVIQIIDVGETVQLPCTAFHNIKRIPITVFWRKEAGPLPEQSYQEHGVLTITNAQHADSGVYVCQAETEERFEQRVTITVGGETPSKPRIQLRPPYLDVIEYSPAEVECVAQSSTPVQYVWTRIDGELSPDAYAAGAWLRFNKVHRGDSGDYQCIARNQYGDDSSVLRVYVRESNPEPTRPPTPPPPSRIVSIEPPNFSSRPGEVLVLTCRNEINLYAPLVWTKYGQLQLPSYVDVRNGVLTINSVRVEDSGRYICTSQPSTPDQTIESVTQIADVNIIPDTNGGQQPVIKPLDELYTVIQGHDFTLICDASGSPYPTVEWKKIHEDSLGSNVQQIGNTLKVFNAQPANRGIYQCTATSNGQSAEISTIIEIEPREAPVVEVYPREPQTVRVGESAMLACRAIAGIPTPTLSWVRRDRAPLSQHVEEKYAGTILISNITFADAGEYECHATNIAGESSLTATIKVQQAPVIRILPEVTELTLTEGDELKLECFAEGLPAPSVRWTEPTTRDAFAILASLPTSRTAPGLIHKYNIRRSDEGTYVCHAQNDAGEDQKYITIFIEQKRGDVGSSDKDEIIDSRPQQPDRPYYPQPTSQPDYNRPDYNRPDYNRPDYNRPDYNRPDYNRPDYNRPDYNRPGYNRPTNNQPTQHITGVGDYTKISCQIENAQKPTTWRRQDGRPLPSNSTLSGSDLIIYYAERDAAGVYECILHEPHGDYPIAVTELVVVDMPRITLYPEMPLTVRSGEQVRIYCNATGDEPVSVNWHAEDHRQFPENVRANERYLEFFHITTSNAGRYYCVANNPYGNVTKAAEVIVHHSEIPDRTTQGRVQEVVEGETVSLECSEPQSPDARFNWRRENGELPRSSTFDRNNRLIIYGIRSEDAGRYVCIKTEPTGQVTQTYLDVVLKPSQSSQPSHPVAPYVQLEPARSYLHPGDSIVVDCKSSSPDSIVTWKREGGRRLPSNFHQQGFQLFITNAQSSDAGKYICVCKTEDGQEFESEYELNVETPPARNEIKPPQIEHAEAGSTVVLNCNPGQYANRYHWSRQQGHFAAGTEISSSDLRLENVQAKDAGTYICTASTGAQSTEIPITLVVTGAIPYFPQAPNSYLVFPKLEDSYMKFNFEVTFNPEREDGLILYNGQKRGEGNYIALSLNDGYPEFRFDAGSGPVIIRAEKPIDIKTWHTVKVYKVRKDGYLLVDDQHPVAFPPTQRSGVELLENLYLGSVPNFNDIAPSASASQEGFVGCISRLILNEREVELKQDAISAVGTTSCETCANDVCENDGVCLETQTEQGFTCVCKAGFTGKTCGVEGLSCSPGICGTGRCENTEIGIECYCPLNKTGDRCQYTEHLDESNLSFKDGSFAAFKTPKSTKLNIRFNVRPENNEDSVIMYVAESDHANGDFAAVVIKDKHYEFRFNTGARIRPVVIRSAEEVDVNKWTSISLGRRHGEGFLKVGDSPQVTGKTIGPARSMYLKTNLYIGGYDKRILLSKGVEVSRGFDGCISGLEVSTQKVDMIKSLLDGANIQNCGDTNEITNIEEPAEPGSECEPGHTGPNCDEVIDVCDLHDPCENNGICQNKGSSYVCNCPIHFTGDVCQYSAPLEFSSQYKGNGFIELNSSALVKSQNEKDILLAILFSTTEPNGLLAWYGQNKGDAYNGQDFIALAVVDGFLEFSLRLDGEETVIKHVNTRIDDGKRHTAVLTRNANRATLELDNFSVYGETTEGSRNYSILTGNLFIGGAPDISTFTGNRYTQGFNGCINIIEGTDTHAINLYENAVSGYNVLPCADNEENMHH